MKVVNDIVALLQQADVPPEDWPATVALAYVMTGMIVMERAEGKGQERARETLLRIADEIRSAIQEWTPGIDIQTQLAARFSGRLGKES
jgi:hypothetical protein